LRHLGRVQNLDRLPPTRGNDPNTPATYNALNLRTSIDDPDPPHDPVETFTCDDDHHLTLDTAERALLAIAER